MLVIKAFHVIAMVAWFAGLFYLPRLFVYHADAADEVSMARFKLMERRLYYSIIWPSAVLTTLFGIILFNYNPQYYFHAGWMHAKLMLVLFLWVYHLTCGHFVKQFAKDSSTHSSIFFRVFNELPTILLIAIVFLVVVKPF
ncbi:protoporphyrinogen oxidase HemJ [Legionella nagasakiensis]|uniref:protoporphyrinogen oxidase HemJ n=1 Tax=Legionella nagasakiensis TaxID=535290 RepID=UPI001056C532|nr:protoporphyrinogen oxidase HemJ [Legionella nagasakiensis]